MVVAYFEIADKSDSAVTFFVVPTWSYDYHSTWMGEIDGSYSRWK